MKHITKIYNKYREYEIYFRKLKESESQWDKMQYEMWEAIKSEIKDDKEKNK